MTREEAIGEITYLVYSNQKTMGSAKLQDALRVITESIRNPVPDPDTGLVPCGCGGKAEEGGLLFDTGDYFTSCRQCGTLSWCMTQKGANKAWNTAMGWKDDAAMQRVDVAPGFDSIRTEGKEHD